MLPAPTFLHHVLAPLAGTTCRYLLLVLVGKEFSPEYHKTVEGRRLWSGFKNE